MVIIAEKRKYRINLVGVLRQHLAMQIAELRKVKYLFYSLKQSFIGFYNYLPGRNAWLAQRRDRERESVVH